MTASRRRLLVAAIAMSLLTSAYYRLTPASIMSEAAHAFLASLTSEQRARAQFDFANEERFFWHYIPADDIPKRYNRERNGLPLRDMTPQQQHLAHALLSAGLSQRGYIKATTIMSLEEVLRLIENSSGGRRDPGKYFFSVFGTPTDHGVWGFRVEGHHVSLHFTIVDGKVAGNPTFFGSNPHRVPRGPLEGMRILGREEDLARDLLGSLTAEQKKAAIVSATAYADILTEASRKAALSGQPSGLAASRLNPSQREMLDRLVEEYALNLPEPLARARLDQLHRAGGSLYFAWAGVEEKGGPHYYRVQTPEFLIEYDNTQNGANHSHTVWRDFNGDWGLDLLKEHYQSSHK